MSTWQIFVDAGNTFRWDISDLYREKEEPEDSVSQEPAIEHRLPSMADLLLQDCSKLLENGEGNAESPPMFRTGLGKSVAVTKSSISKARSILGDVDIEVNDLDCAGQLDRKENGNNFSKPTFQTGFLKPDVTFGSGFQNCSNNDVDMSNSMFQTGSGKAVSISSAGLHRAKAMLGLEKNSNHESFDGFEQTRKHLTASQLLCCQNSSPLEMEDPANLGFSSVSRITISPYIAKSNPLRSEFKEFTPDFVDAANKPPPVKFHTAGGRSISVSTDALQRARNLLGDPELDSFLCEADVADPAISIFGDGKTTHISNEENYHMTPFSCNRPSNGNSLSKNFTSPLRSISYQKQSSGRLETIGPGNNLIKKFDAEARNNTLIRPYNGTHVKPLKNKFPAERVDCLENGIHSRIDPTKRLSNGPLADISNSNGRDDIDNKQCFGEKRRLGRINSVSPFKRPRTSKFVTPLHKNDSSVPNGLSRVAPNESCSKGRVSMRYPFQVPRVYMKEYISQSSCIQKKLEDLPFSVRKMNPTAAGNYTFHSEPVSDCIGPEAFIQMLSQSGASQQYLTKEWVSNHYKWIVWKLASYERCYPAKFSGTLLTVSNVLEELKYRYEREVNHGHRSAIKKILDGDVPPSSMMVLCISSVGENGDPKFGPQSVLSEGDDNATVAKIELTDGWYSVKALLDELLSKKLAAGKLFLGQKLRIWGAKLCGWVGPISPLEVSQTTSILLHINGTYRCHWAERLGFCKSASVPLAFKCIKGTGGAVPSTLVGVERIYPILYRERLSNGDFVVRSVRMEAKVQQSYNQRRSVVAEGIMSEFQNEKEVSFDDDDHDNDEGAKLLKLLETAAEPELLMAGMSSKQLTSFTSYKAKLEEIRQLDMQKSIEKALEASGLNEREVTPFMRVRVVGLTNKCHQQKCYPGKGLITIWNPTEKQKLDLIEGQAYAVGGLLPCSSYSGTLYLKARGSTTNWLPLSPSIMEKYEPFFTPRSSVKISNLGEVPLSSEFDIAAFVVYVGEVYTEAHQKKQWVFVTDESASELISKESSDTLLAISFYLPYTEWDSFAPINNNVAGSVVVFRNLIKRPKDQVNNLWVAEATENSEYSISYDLAGHNYLKDTATSILKWAKTSSLIIEKLKEEVLSIVRNSEVVLKEPN
ncbi:BREAST CANCER SUSCEPTIBILITY 2 homolog B-like isoform X1 [Olea europaea subsp. europaea]|uniref:BREAST CANCER SUSCEPTIBILITY 2 homolog B-like isoform X1 n=1 Tax=Olea europaea subsp. europaea TaxID=158383 RepID=A0A8S0QVN2_OLEEU|nr:BREAST CANCER SUSCEPTIBILITY 2 homolog B-like isoform X1 [Olea europaea subsp. europaea]